MARLVRNLITQEATMPIIHYPDNFKIEVVKHYKMHRNIDLTLEKYGIARSTLFKWKKKYEGNYFFRVSKKPTDTGHKAKAHLPRILSFCCWHSEISLNTPQPFFQQLSEQEHEGLLAYRAVG